MTLDSLLTSLTEEERNFIASLDYGQDAEQHRTALDAVISEGGHIDLALKGRWFPYEVLELGKNWLQSGHEREYAACLGIVLTNLRQCTDTLNDLEDILEHQTDSISKLPEDLKNMVTELLFMSRAWTQE